MNGLRVIYHLARADFLERTRRYSFLVTLVLVVFMAYSYVPSRDSWYITLSVDGARGLYNSAWVGSLVAILSGITLPFVGFYLVNNAVERDFQTRVGQIMATTPLSRPLYTMGKWLSNFAVLAAFTGVIALSSIALQLFIGEDRSLEFIPLLAPILLILLPTMALVSALAVLFEIVGWLGHGLGNIIHFFVCTAVTMMSFMPIMLSEAGSSVSRPLVDLFGVGLPLSSMLRATMNAFPNIDFGNNSIGPVPVSLAGPLQTFVWDGVMWTPKVITGRLSWIASAIPIALLAALFFNRFDPARERRRKSKDQRGKTIVVEAGGGEDHNRPSVPTASPSTAQLTPLAMGQMRFSFWRVFQAELRLMRKGLRWWWIVVAVVLVLAGALAPVDVARRYVLPLTWLWPLLIWSKLGTREARFHTAGMVFSAARPLGHQLPATWLAGVLVTALTGSGFAFNLLRAGDPAGVVAWAAAVLFIPSLALALAIWSGSSKLFEVVYLALWYIGPLNHVLPQADFMGASGASGGISYVYLVVAFALLGAAFWGRQRQI